MRGLICKVWLGTTLGALGAGAGTTVYRSNFEKEVTAEWSDQRTEVTPKDRRFLGPGTTDKISLKLEKLPKHQYVRISLMPEELIGQRTF